MIASPMLKQLCVLCVVGATVAHAAVEQAKSADAFVDSIGINTHYGNSIYVGGNAYANPVIDTKLGDLGIRHLRDHSWNDEALAKIDSLNTTYGIKANLILGETTRSPADLVNLLKAHPGYEGIEGLNEPDFNTRSYGGFTDNPSTHDFSATKAFQNDMYAAVKADPQTASRTIVSPAMGNSANSVYLLGSSFDVEAMHSYPTAHSPTFNLDTKISQTHQMSASGSPHPIMSTETGYYNRPADGGQVSENAMMKYTPLLYAEYFNRGIARTYGYELADQGPDATQREQNFGLVRYDMTVKPAYTAMKNLIDLVEEPGASSPPGTLNYTMSAASTVHHTLLAKTDGTMYLLLWNEVASWSLANAQDINNADQLVTLTLSDAFAEARTYLPGVSASPTATYLNPTTLNLSVPDQVLVLELSHVPEPAIGGAFVVAASFIFFRRAPAVRR